MQNPGNSPWQLLVGLCALGVFISYADRSNISTAVISMSAEFNWTKTFEGVVLSSFFAGYAATQLLGGKFADQYGGKGVLATGLSIWSLATFLTPQAAFAGPYQARERTPVSSAASSVLGPQPTHLLLPGPSLSTLRLFFQ